MTIDAIKTALELLESDSPAKVHMARGALRAAIEKAEKQGPVMWERREDGKIGPTVWTGADFSIDCTPQPREWVGLTEEEMHECADSPWTPTGLKAVRAIEAKLKEKNCA
jgi:hypothetical protein